MVNPIKFISRATGLSNLIEKSPEAPAASQVAQPAAPPSPAPIVGQEATPNKPQRKQRQFAPSIISAASSDTPGGKTLIGQ